MKTGSVILKFDNDISFNQKEKHVRDGLSGALITGKNLWISCDERSSIERLTLLKDGSFGNHQSFELNKLLELPDCNRCEIDIEGLGLESDKYLWLIGSHGLSRKKPQKSDKPAKQIESLAKVKEDPNRYLLARIPLVLDKKTGNYDLVQSYTDPDKDHTLSCAQLLNSKKGNQLMEVLSHDPHLKQFMDIPGKDNGFDIEGLAVDKHKIFIGVRGPVLRGWAIILEIMVKEHSEGYLKLKAGKKR